MNKKILFPVLAISLLSGCAGKTVVSYVDESTSITDTTASSSAENEPTVAEDPFNGIKWQEDVLLPESGKTVHISLKSKSLIEDNDYKKITAREYTSLTPTEKEKLLKAIFPDGEIYVFDDSNLPKAYLEYYIDLYSLILRNDGNEDVSDPVTEDILAEYKERYSNAPDFFSPAEDFTSDKYVGYIDGIPFCLEIDLDSISDMGINDATYPMLYRTIQLSYCYELMQDVQLPEINTTKEEKNEIATKIVEGLPFDNYFYTSPRYFGGETWVCFSQAIPTFDGNYGPLFSDPRVTSENYPDLDLVGRDYSSHNRGIEVCFNSTGIYRININFPVEILDIEDVELIPISQIEAAIVKELEENGDDHLHFLASDAIGVNKLELGYVYVPLDGSENVSIIPCWKFGDVSFAKPIVVNAITGEVLDDFWWGLEAYFLEYNKTHTD